MTTLTPNPPTGTGAALITDTFTGTDGTALATYNAAYSTFGTGSEINGHKARLSSSASAGGAVRDTGATDHEVSIDIVLPANPVSGDWFCGPVVRYVDSNNHLNARFLYQTNSPEVEVCAVVGGVATVVNFYNLGAGNLAGSTTHRLRMAAKGAEVAIYWTNLTSGTAEKLIHQYTTTLLTGTKAGYAITSPASGQPTFDNLSVKAT